MLVTEIAAGRFAAKTKQSHTRASAAGTMTVGAVHAGLRRETRTRHVAIERRLGLATSRLTRERYFRILRAFYGFYEPLESRLQRLHAVEPAPDFGLPRRAARLEADLLALGVDAEELAAAGRCARLPRLVDSCTLAGCLYVVEGAALGGELIARLVERRFGYTADHGACFFSSGGEDPARRWRRVLRWLEATAEACRGERQIIRSAQETFDLLAAWMESEALTQ